MSETERKKKVSIVAFFFFLIQNYTKFDLSYSFNSTRKLMKILMIECWHGPRKYPIGLYNLTEQFKAKLFFYTHR